MSGAEAEILGAAAFLINVAHAIAVVVAGAGLGSNIDFLVCFLGLGRLLPGLVNGRFALRVLEALRLQSLHVSARRLDATRHLCVQCGELVATASTTAAAVVAFATCVIVLLALIISFCRCNCPRQSCCGCCSYDCSFLSSFFLSPLFFLLAALLFGELKGTGAGFEGRKDGGVQQMSAGSPRHFVSRLGAAGAAGARAAAAMLLRC